MVRSGTLGFGRAWWGLVRYGISWYGMVYFHYRRK